MCSVLEVGCKSDWSTALLQYVTYDLFLNTRRDVFILLLCKIRMTRHWHSSGCSDGVNIPTSAWTYWPNWVNHEVTSSSVSEKRRFWRLRRLRTRTKTASVETRRKWRTSTMTTDPDDLSKNQCYRHIHLQRQRDRWPPANVLRYITSSAIVAW